MHAPAAGLRAAVGLAPERTYLPELESLRGIAILLVLTFHVDSLVRPGLTTGASLLSSFVRAGHVGVVLFFVLSAFLLSLPFLAEARCGRRVDLRHYAARRALRILPAYWLAVVVGTVLTSDSARDLVRGLPYLVFLNGLPLPDLRLFPYHPTWWSLATEVQFYLLLPLLPYVARRRSTALAALAGCVLLYAAILTGVVAAGSVRGQISLLGSIAFRGPEFATGIVCAFVWQRHGPSIRRALAARPWVRRGGADVLLACLLLALAWHLRNVTAWGLAGEIAWHKGSHAATGVLFGMLVLLILLAPLRTKLLLCNPLLARLGMISYSIYLIHVPFMWFALGSPLLPVRLGTWLATARVVVFALACVACSAMTYRLVEKPFLARKARLSLSG